MPVYVIQTTEIKTDGKRRYCYVDAHHETLEALAYDLRGGPVVVDQLFAFFQEAEQNFTVKGRRPLLMTAGYVHHAFIPDKPFLEDVEVSADDKGIAA